MFEEHLLVTIALLKRNPVIAVAIAGLIAALCYYKPKQMFKLVLLGLVIAMVLYGLSLFSGTVSTGAKQKDQMIHKTKEALGE